MVVPAEAALPAAGAGTADTAAVPMEVDAVYLGAVSTPLDAATAQAAPLPAAAAAEVRKDWTELEDEEILRRHTPRARALAPCSPGPSPSPTP